MKVKALKLKDEHYQDQWFDETENRWNYADFKNNEKWRKGWISFDCSLYDEKQDRVYLGITSFDSDIYKAYDRKKGEFVDLGYDKIADPYDAKFHRSLEHDKDGNIIAAIALLHDVDDYLNAPGGAIIKHDPRTGEINKLGIPEAHVYIQSIAVDQEKNLAYCLCFAPEKILVFDLENHSTRDLGLISSGIAGMAQGENIALDDDGNLWSAWANTRAWQSSPGPDYYRICKYDAGKDKMVFFKTGLPKLDGSYGTEKCETLFNFHDEYMYASGAGGSLFKIDRDSGEAEHVVTPVKDRASRLSSLLQLDSETAIGVIGRNKLCELAIINFKKGQVEVLGKIEDGNDRLYQSHHLRMTKDRTLYVCENDHPKRSSYLWEISL